MLDILRANTRSILTYVLFGIIIVVFVVSFGPGSRGCTDADVRGSAAAARVGKQTVTGAEFEQAYRQLYRAYQGRSGGALTPELAEQLGLRSLAMDQLVERELVVAEAGRHGVVVGDEEVSRAVVEMRQFRTNGSFDQALYERAVTGAYGSPKRFEELVRRDLAYDRMLGLVRETVKLSEDEIREAWLAEKDRVSLELVRFPLAAARAEVKVGEGEAKAFAAANGPRVEEFYRDHPERFQKKKRVRARHILLRLPEGAPEAEERAAREKIEGLAARVARGEDFAALAKQYSEDPGSKDRGGDLGFFSEGLMAKPFEAAAFALAPGQVSAPVRTRFGWHLIRVEEVQPPETVPFEKARLEIARELLEEERARALATRRAEEALARVRAGERLSELFPPAPKDGKPRAGGPTLGGQPLVAEPTGPFGRSGETVPVAGAVPGLSADAFAAGGPGPLPRVYQGASGPLIAVVTERQKPDPAQFAAQREQAAGRARSRREAQVVQAWLRALREKADVRVNEAYLRGPVRGAPVDLDY